MLAHFKPLGVTALELLPVHYPSTNRASGSDQGLRNHWGYNTLAFFCPDPRYATVPVHDLGAHDAAVRAEFRAMVQTPA
jgi:glycogen operon protein